MASISRKYATIHHPTIAALVGGHYRYKEKAQALTRFKNIAEHFVLSREQPQSSKDHPFVVFWIKGFALSEADDVAGFIGHFARMEITTLPNGLFSLRASKVERELSSHPQKKRPTSKHPNWGHPVMRAIKRAKPYKSIEDAQSELDLLHLEFPEVSIPGPGKLYIIVYEKREGIKRPTHKMAIEIEVRHEGGFVLVARDNEKKPTTAADHLPEAPDENGPEGYFAAVEALRKAKRRKPPVTTATLNGDGAAPASFTTVEKERKKRKKKKAPPRVSAAAPGSAEQAAAQARFRAAEEEREKRRRRRTTLLDAVIKTKRDRPT